MSGSGGIFNNPNDDLIFTGSRFRAGTSVDKLKLSKGENTYIDICENYIDISAINVFINKKKVLIESSTLTVENISAGTIDISTNLNVTGVTRLGANLYVQGDVSINGTKMYVPAEFTIDPAPIDDKAGKVVIKGDLEVQGTTTTINSNRVDISDLSITLASNARTPSEAQDAGFDICGTGGASFRYDLSNGIGKFKSSIGLSISGNLLPFNRNSQVPVSSNTYMLKKTGFSSYVTTASNEWVDLNGYDISKVVLSNYSYIKMEFKVNFSSSPEAEQYLGFRVERSILDSSWTTVFTDPSLGSNMGVGLISVYNGTYIDDLNGAIISDNIVTYKLSQRRNLPSYDGTISNFGVIGGDAGNYIFLQELYRPPP
jgi:hypothetical protein